MYFRYGSQVLKYLSHDQVSRSDLPNPMCTVFPTVTRYGHRILLLIILNHVFIKKRASPRIPRTNLSNCFTSFRKNIETQTPSFWPFASIPWGCVWKLCNIYWLTILFAFAWPSLDNLEKFIILVDDDFIRCKDLTIIVSFWSNLNPIGSWLLNMIKFW